MIGLTWRATRSAASWEVARLDGQPRIGSTAAGRHRAARPSSDARAPTKSSRARVDVGTIGQVTIDPDTRDAASRVARRASSACARTRHAARVDLGPARPVHRRHAVGDGPPISAAPTTCTSTRTVGPLTVVAGWVAFERDGRESFVPAGASAARTRSAARHAALRQREPGVPRRAGRLRLRSIARDARRRAAASCSQLGGNGDAITLWHLIARVASRRSRRPSWTHSRVGGDAGVGDARRRHAAGPGCTGPVVGRARPA